MKLLNHHSLESINNSLAWVDVGEYVLSGKLEAYSSKPDNTERELSRTLESKFCEFDAPGDYMDAPISCSPTSPYGGSPFAFDEDSANSRRTFITLISTLNAAFPDYNFSTVRPQCFMRESSPDMVVNSVNLSLRDAFSKEQLYELWEALDEVIGIQDCEVYSFNDTDSGLDEHKLWSFNLFFLNRKLKRVAFFTCSAERPEMMEDEEEYYDSVGTHGTKNADYYYSRVEGNKNFDHWFGGGSHFAAAAAEATFSMELDGEGNEEGGRGGAEEEEEEEGVRGGTSGAPAAFMAPPPPQHAAAPHRSWGGGF